MNNLAINSSVSKISKPAVRLALAASIVALLLLGSLLVLSPEFDPSWRMVSEYANGHYGWVLSLMFLSWGVGSLALAYAISSQIKTRAGKIGLVFLIIAGIGEAMASVFDINHPPFHDLAGMLGIGGLPVAAILISIGLGRTQAWSATKKILLRTANLTWISVVLLIASFIVLIIQYTRAGGDMNPNAVAKVLPPGVIALVGWADRLLIVVYCAWVIIVAWQALKLRAQKS